MFASSTLDMATGAFRKNPAPQPRPGQPSKELEELCNMVLDQVAMVSSVQKELAGVSAKAEAESKRKLVGIPPLCKAKVDRIRDLENKPHGVFSVPLALPALV